MRDSICYAFGVDFAAVGSSDVTVYQEIKPIDLDVKTNRKVIVRRSNKNHIRQMARKCL